MPDLRRIAAAALALAAGALATPAAAQAAAPAGGTGPGRVAFAVDDGAILKSVDGSGAGWAFALPDGGALLVGTGATRGALYAARIDARGALVASFGTAGVVTLPGGAAVLGGVLQILRQPDGKLLLIGSDQALSLASALRVTRLNADLTLDRTYGSGGTATTVVGVGCGSCTTGALAPDGSLVLTGATGTVTSPTPALRWTVTRLTPSGETDRGFGADGVATIPTAVSTSGLNVAIDGRGAIVVEGQAQASLLGGETNLVLARLTPAGAMDPAYAGGKAIDVPFESGRAMLVRDDGAVVVQGDVGGSILPLPIASRQLLARYTAAGALDPAFGRGGFADLGTAITPSQLLPADGGALLVAGTPTYVLAPRAQVVLGRLNVRRVLAGGAIDGSFGGPSGHTFDIPFGGGGSSFLVSVRPRPVAGIVQNSFRGDRLVPRPDGSYLVAGGVGVSQPTGEGTGFSIGRFAVAALTPAITLDASFGAPASPLRLTVRVPRQRARTAREAHGIRVVVTASAVGLARVKILHGARAVAHSLLPVFGTTSRTLPVELTAYGNAYLRRHRNVTLTVRASGRDLLTNTATTTARGRLR
jgi:uncharacterized delta-60 repeat protein